MRTLTLTILATLPLAAARPLPAQDILLSRVVDVGAGLCVVTIAPGEPRPGIMVYDANFGCKDAVADMVVGDTIDLLVISHTDADHLADADNILGDKSVKLVLRPGSRRTGSGSMNYGRMEDDIGEETKEDRASVLNLATFPLEPGTEFPLGDATVTFVAGWPEWTLTDLHGGEALNAISIVVRLDYDGRSILLTGDTVGRLIGQPDSVLRARGEGDDRWAGAVRLGRPRRAAPWGRQRELYLFHRGGGPQVRHLLGGF